MQVDVGHLDKLSREQATTVPSSFLNALSAAPASGLLIARKWTAVPKV